MDIKEFLSSDETQVKNVVSGQCQAVLEASQGQ